MQLICTAWITSQPPHMVQVMGTKQHVVCQYFLINPSAFGHWSSKLSLSNPSGRSVAQGNETINRVLQLPRNPDLTYYFNYYLEYISRMPTYRINRKLYQYQPKVKRKSCRPQKKLKFQLVKPGDGNRSKGLVLVADNYLTFNLTECNMWNILWHVKSLVELL
jgi:hypothetical protein